MRPERIAADLPDMMEATYALVAQVPEGRVTTYGEVAKALGDTVASRYVGLAMSLNQDIVRVPCRRVVQSDGSIGGYTGGGPTKKMRLLRKEGVKVIDGRIVDFEDVLFKDFVTQRPLLRLRDEQKRLKRRLRTSSLTEKISMVAGIDVAYQGDHSHAAMVVFDYDSGEEIEHFVVEGDAKFPYIPTYLAFREIPVIAPLMDYVDKGTVVMYDGHGIMHPEGFGIASQLGVVFGVPTIGVAKKLLCGDVSKSPGTTREVRVNGKVLGYALSKRGSARPVYVSPGHMISPSQAKAVAMKFMRYKIPEPTRRAHIVAESARRGRTNK